MPGRDSQKRLSAEPRLPTLSPICTPEADINAFHAAMGAICAEEGLNSNNSSNSEGGESSLTGKRHRRRRRRCHTGRLGQIFRNDFELNLLPGIYCFDIVLYLK